MPILFAAFCDPSAHVHHRCNETLVDEPPTAVSFVGILDIFGFESFKVNSFEQLCSELHRDT